MPHNIVFAGSVFDTLKDVLAVLGVLFSIVAGTMGILYARRRRTEAQQDKKRQDDRQLSENFSHFRDDITKLKQQVQSLQQQDTDSRVDYKKDVERHTERLGRLEESLGSFREQISDRYITITAHQSDLLLMTNTLNNVQQMIRDMNQTLSTAIQRRVP